MPGTRGLILFFGVGAVAGPPLAGWLMAWLGPRAFPALLAALLAALALFAQYRRLHGAALRPAEQTPHVSVPARTPELTAGMLVESADAGGEASAGRSG